MGAVEQVRQVVGPVVATTDAELWDVELEAGILRVVLDKSGGIDLDTIGDLAQRISEALDREDPMPGDRYLLEVTSPGVERKLRTPEHYRRQQGEEVALKLRQAINGVRRLQAQLVAADDRGVDLGPPRSGEEPVRPRLTYDEIESARTVFHWEDGITSGRTTTEKEASAS